MEFDRVGRNDTVGKGDIHRTIDEFFGRGKEKTKEEEEMYLEFKRKELEDADAMRDAQRNMAWFALAGMLLYPACVVISVVGGIESAAKILGDMAGVYFIAVAGIVAAFFGAQAMSKKTPPKK